MFEKDFRHDARVQKPVGVDLAPMYALQRGHLLGIFTSLTAMLCQMHTVLRQHGVAEYDDMLAHLAQFKDSENPVVAINMIANMCVGISEKLNQVGQRYEAVGAATKAQAIYRDYDPDVAEIVRWGAFSDDVYTETGDYEEMAYQPPKSRIKRNTPRHMRRGV